MIMVPKGAIRRRKRVGRGAGSGTGCTAGRGTKGQKARSGGKIRAGFEGGQMPLYRRLPRRGFTNASFKKDPTIVSLYDIERVFEATAEVSVESLRAKGLIKKNEKRVKILGGGKISKAVVVASNIALSKSARRKILASSGTVEEKDGYATEHRRDSPSGSENAVAVRVEDVSVDETTKQNDVSSGEHS